MKLRIVVGCVLGLALAGQARAQPPADEDAPVVEALVVTAADGGPAWWRISDDDTILYVLVLPSAAPKAMAWDKKTLERRMNGATQLIQQPTLSINILQAVPLAATLYGKARTKSPLPADLKARVSATLVRMGKKPDAYEGWQPSIMASMIEGDLRSKALTGGEALKAVRASARSHRVKTVNPIAVGFKEAKPAIKEEFGPEGLGAQERGRACLAMTLDTMDAIADADRRAALAWARGDVRGLLALRKVHERPPCGNASGKLGREVYGKVLAGEIAALETALKTPGHAIALVSPEMLLQKGGVLETMKARGYRITTPAVLDD